MDGMNSPARLENVARQKQAFRIIGQRKRYSEARIAANRAIIEAKIQAFLDGEVTAKYITRNGEVLQVAAKKE
jgi:predicted transcriptional regulator YdeE